jgi:hypothetical protein
MVVDPVVERGFQPELVADERVVWTGRPDPTRLLNRADIGLIPFSLLWGGFALAFFFQAVTGRAEADTPTILMGAVFAVVGLYFIVGRFLVKAFRKRHTFYAVTDRRVLVLTDLGRRSLNAALIGQIPAIQKHVRTDGVGSLRFGTGGGLASMYEDTGLELFGAFYGAPAPAFVNIAGANDVAKLVTRLQAERPGS